MVNCHEMKKGTVYVCDGCGLELQVMSECKDAGKPAEDCSCAPCMLRCCGKDLELKQ